MNKLAIGRIVHYYSKGQTSAAIVARVLDEAGKIVNLQVVEGGKHGTTLATNVPHGFAPKEGVWSWPDEVAPTKGAAPAPAPAPAAPAPAPAAQAKPAAKAKEKDDK